MLVGLTIAGFIYSLYLMEMTIQITQVLLRLYLWLCELFCMFFFYSCQENHLP